MIRIKVWYFLDSGNKKDKKNKDENYFYIDSVRGAKGKGQITSEGFVVLKGSRMSNNTVDSAQNWVIKKRKELLEKEIVVENDENYIFKKDYLFSSSSTAAAVVMGRNANGLREWKLKNGCLLYTSPSPRD